MVFVNRVHGTALYDIYPGREGSHQIALLPFNAPLRLLERGGDFVRVQNSGESGWVSSEEIGLHRSTPMMYIHSLFPVPLARNPGSGVTEGDPFLHNGAKLRILSGSIVAGSQFLEVETESSEAGWVLGSFIRERPADFFFYVYPYDGVILRKSPDPASEMVARIPHGLVVKISDVRRAKAPGGDGNMNAGAGPGADSTIDVEDDGIWFYMKRGRRAGWVHFRSPVVTDDPGGMRTALLMDADESFRRYLDRPVVLPGIEEDLSQIARNYSRRKIEHSGSYDIIQLGRNVAPDSCEQNPVSRIVFRSKDTKRLYGIVPGYSETVLPGPPLHDSLYTLASHCNCCCPLLTNQLYLLLSEQILVLDYLNENIEGAGYCDYGPVYRIVPGRETRFPRDGRSILTYMKLPSCPLEGSALENDIPPGGKTIYYPKHALHELFLKLEVDGEKNRITIHKYFDRGIPEEFRREWDGATPLPSGKPQRQDAIFSD